MPFPRHSIQIVGNLGKNAEMRYTPSGSPVTQFSVAVSREWEQNNEKHKETTWYQVTCWNKLAEMTAQLHKGQQVLIVGRIKPDATTGGPRIWSRQDGTAGATFEVAAQEVWLSIYSGADGPQYVADESSQIPPEEEDIPF